MPVNPMQRRIKNSFLLGFLVAVIIMALVVCLLLLNMKKIKDENRKLIDAQKTVIVPLEDLKSGERVTFEDFVPGTVQSTVNPSQIITADDFELTDEEGNFISNKELIVKVDIPAGSIVTKDMLAESERDMSNDLRIQEFHMISLPSELEEGDYIDVRWSIPQGQDYIVLSKKQVLKTTETGIWLDLTEEEILMINNAIVEAYTVRGSKLYALEYSEPGLQKASEPTYPVNGKVFELIEYNPNIVKEAKDAVRERLYANNLAAANQRAQYIDPVVSENASEMTESIETKTQEEISKIQSEREEYLNSLGM